jgi:hypothetical protein
MSCRPWGGPRRSLGHHGASGGALERSLGVRWRSPRALGILGGIPWGPWGVPGVPWELPGGSPGGPWRILGGPWGYLGGPWGGPGESLGFPGEVCGGAWVGIEKHCFLKAHGEEREAFPFSVRTPPGPPGTPQDPPEPPRARPSGTRGLSQSLRCATLRFSLRFRFRFASLGFRFASLFASLRSRFASLRFSNRTESNLEPHTPTGRRM